MQEMDGLDLIRHIHDHHPRTLVIVITGYASAESAIEAVHYHAFDYLKKPFDFDDLKHAVDRAYHKIEIDRLREDTAAMITHDIKAPLTSMIGFAALIHDPKTGPLHPKVEEYARLIYSNGQRVLALIDNYLTQFKVEMGRLTVNRRSVQSAEFMSSLLDMYGREAEHKGFTMRHSVEVGCREVCFDEHLMFRAIGNLIQNAIKYGDPVKPIGISLFTLDSSLSPLGEASVCFSVVNAAPELRSAELDQIFGRFKRAQTQRSVEGSGLGLYVVDQVARAHGGQAAVSMSEDATVTFSIIFPIAPNTAADDPSREKLHSGPG
jgi:signal transduction histidine kinase